MISKIFLVEKTCFWIQNVLILLLINKYIKFVVFNFILYFLCIKNAINCQHWTSCLINGIYLKNIFLLKKIKKWTHIYINIIHQVKQCLLTSSFRCSVLLYLRKCIPKSYFLAKKYTFSFFSLKSGVSRVGVHGRVYSPILKLILRFVFIKQHNIIAFNVEFATKFVNEP